MCGIAGVAFNDTSRKADHGLLERMCSALAHRGPDSSGGIIEPGIGLCMRRLSVIDVEGGHQPIFNEDNSIAVVLNGEIYNYHELREQLIAKGHRFSSKSDTETIVHLYEQHGLDFLRHLHGMFAIAIWDFRQRGLILARDRLGVKPLYYRRDDDKLTFASEIKAILQDPTIPREIDFKSIHQLLTWGHVLPPRTPFSGIQELPPGHMLVFKSGHFETSRYWDLTFSEPATHDQARTTEDLLSRIKIAVARRMVSDVPLGAFLSGGIDSSIVVALMSQFLPHPVKTFSIGFEDESFSELPYARKVAEHCGTDHHELIVSPDIPELMDELIYHHDAPFYDTSAIPTYCVSKFAREHVTVAMSGDGGDEMFAGYNIYVANKAAHRFKRVPRFLGKIILEPLAALVPESGGPVNRGRVAREFMKGATLPTLERYTRWATKVKREVRDMLYYETELQRQQSIPDEAMIAPYFEAQRNCSELSRLLYIGTKTELPADMLRKVDRMSMAHSLEVRSPFLDHTLFEYAATLHDDAKLNKWSTKHSLRQVAKRLLPAEVVDRKKRGFSVPLDRWLREDVRDYMLDVLCDQTTESRGVFDNITVRSLIEEHFDEQFSRGRELWTLMTIEVWQRNYIDHFAYHIDNPEPLPLVSPASMTQGA